MIVSEMKHDDIAELMADRLRRGKYKFAFANITSAYNGEQPDALGIDGYMNTILIEVKTSRSDFKADAKKPWRQNGRGIGKRRVYVTTAGLLRPDEIPYGWELWEIHGKNKPIVKIIKGQKEREIPCTWRDGTTIEKYYPHCSKEEWQYFRITDDTKSVASYLLTFIDRMVKDGVDIPKYANGKHCGGIKLS